MALAKEEKPHVVDGWEHGDHPDLHEYSTWADYLRVHQEVTAVQEE